MKTEWFDSNWHMQPQGENGVLFTAYYMAMVVKEHYFWYWDINAVDRNTTAILAALKYTKGEPLSHDNMTGIVCISKSFKLNYHKRLCHRDWHRRLHPRDVAFYLYAKHRWLKPLTSITMISMVWACWHKQISNGVLDTDGKLLAWLRFETFDWKWTRRLCTYIIKKRHGKNWADLFQIYFGGYSMDHPNIILSRKLYGGKDD